jgi:hypothetical protein
MIWLTHAYENKLGISVEDRCKHFSAFFHVQALKCLIR